MQQTMQAPQPPAQYVLPTNNAPMPIVLSNHQNRSGVRENYHVKCVKGLSITQIVLGSLAIILQIWDLINESQLSAVGTGIWTGILFIIAGSLGVVSSNTRTTCAIVSFLVMSIIASVITWSLLGLSATSLGLASSERDQQTDSYNYHYNYYSPADLNHTKMTMAIGALLVLISLTEAIVAIMSSCFACHVLCCTDTQVGTVLVQGQVQYIQGPNGQAQMVIIPMQNQTNIMMANPPYQYTNPVGGYQPQPLAAPAGGALPGSGMPTACAQVHHAVPGTPAQPPTYSRQASPPPQYEQEKQGERM